MEYPFLDIEKIKTVLGDRVLCEWEEAKEELLGGLLVKPDTHRSAHYTGIILKRGLDVGEEELQEGARIFWEQFSGFEKYQSEDGKKRYAFVKEDAIHAVIPKRAKIAADDWTQYGTGDD